MNYDFSMNYRPPHISCQPVIDGGVGSMEGIMGEKVAQRQYGVLQWLGGGKAWLASVVLLMVFSVGGDNLHADTMVEQETLNMPTGLHQFYPYNSTLPNVTFTDGTSRTPAAGCVPLAIARVAFYKKGKAPDQYLSEFQDLLRNIHLSSPDLLLYLSNGTFVASGNPLISEKGFKIMARNGFTFSNYKLFSDSWLDRTRISELYTYVRDSIRNRGEPVIAMSQTGGHAFVIDGYMTMDPDYGNEDLYLHVLWGWTGTDGQWIQIDKGEGLEFFEVPDPLVEQQFGDFSLRDAEFFSLGLKTFPVFDGAGSLIDSSRDCDGCNRDIAKMQNHDNGAPSTVVFQWKYNSNNCDHIEISAKSDIGEVIVQSRDWESQPNTIAYRGRLPLSVPKQGSWNITSVTSTVSLTTPTRVYANCKKSNDGYYSGTAINPGLVGFDFGYYWTGNGSLMSFAWTGNSNDVTGKIGDFAITSNSYKSLTLFQWYASDSCRQITIEDDMGYAVTLNGVQNGVAIKQWEEPKWENASYCTSLPCTVTAPGKDYYLIKIKTDAGAVPNGYLKATCF